MLLQTNSYIVPKEKRAAHASLLARFRETLARLGSDVFEIYEQVGTDWDTSQTSGRFVQIMRFRDREHQLAVQAAERTDREAQLLIAEFCELINFPYQEEHGFFAVGFYTNILSESNEGDGGAVDEPEVEDAPPGSEVEGDSELSESPMRLASADSDADDSGIGRVLDAGLSGDELDVPLPAELFEEGEEMLAPESMDPPPETRTKSKPPKKATGRR
jgi:hypothetical protein